MRTTPAEARLTALLTQARLEHDRLVEERGEAFLRGASWAYQELTGAIIVPASFEEQAREAREGEGK